jgi:hypothetical protein
VLNKEPGAEKATPWHHDQSYYPIKGDKVNYATIYLKILNLSQDYSPLECETYNLISRYQCFRRIYSVSTKSTWGF